MSIFKDYYCTTYREGTHQGDSRTYLFINRRGTDARITSFRMFTENNAIWINNQASWDTYAPLIIEYCVNDLKKDYIFVSEEYRGN